MRSSKVLFSILLIGLLTVTTSAQVSITTADGNGADAGISNDSNKTASWVGGTGTVMEIRHYDGVRAKAFLLRFDITGLDGVDLSDATLQITTTSGTRSLAINVYGLMDESYDFWNEAEMCYNNLPGMQTAAEGYLSWDNTMWPLIGTVPFTNAATTHSGIVEGLTDMIASDTNGVISLLLYTATSDSGQTWYCMTKEYVDGTWPTILFPNSKGASAPSPAYGDTVLPSISELCWTNPEPNDIVSGNITSDIYLGNGEPNLAYANYGLSLIQSNYSGTCLDISEIPLSSGIYYWRVDSHDSSFESDYHSPFWMFEVTETPIIDVNPIDQYTRINTTAEFSVEVTSQSVTHYYWYMSDDNSNNTFDDDSVIGTDSSILSLENIGVSDIGYYYCKIINASGVSNAVYSEPAKLYVLRETAHWTLDELTEGVFEDITGEGHPASPMAEPVFIEGINGMALDITSGAYSVVNNWNPAEETGSFSVALWVNWNGQPDPATYQGLVAKSNGWGADTEMWQLGISAGSVLGAIRASGSTISSSYSLSTGSWELVVFSSDGATGTIYQLRNGNVHILTANGTYTFGPLTDSDFVFGATNQYYPDPFNGLMDDIIIYNYKLEPKDVIDLYNQSLPGSFCALEYGSSEFNLDLNNNCIIDLGDFASLALTWLECGYYPNCPYLSVE